MSVLWISVIPFPSSYLPDSLLGLWTCTDSRWTEKNINRTKLLWYKVTTTVPHSSLPTGSGCLINVHPSWCILITTCHFITSPFHACPLSISTCCFPVAGDMDFTWAHGKQSKWFLRFACCIPLSIDALPPGVGLGYIGESKQPVGQRASPSLQLEAPLILWSPNVAMIWGSDFHWYRVKKEYLRHLAFWCCWNQS